MDGVAWGAFGVALCVLLCGCGSAIGLTCTGRTAAGVLAEKPKKFGSVLVLAVLPATQGIYGFVLGIIGMGKVVAGISTAVGMEIFMSCLPLAIVGFISSVFQGITSVGGLNALAKKDLSVGRLILFPAMVETYAILALVVSIMMMP